MTADEHAARVAAWRRGREEKLRRPTGWLALVGLHWLVEGENRFGAHPANQVVLHGTAIPPRAGSLWLEDGRVRLVPHPEADLLIGGELAPERWLNDDHDADPTIMELGTLRMLVIRRGERVALRVRDTEAPALQSFAGMHHFPIDPSWSVVGRFEPAAAGTSIEITDITGVSSETPTPGDFVFERGGREWRITALDGGEDGSLWLIFADATSGSETYGGGRFLYSEPPAADGSVVADFNLAYNPPCVFSPYATCPLPPQQNRLSLAIRAGERTYHRPG
jgi:uncharacterized protein (DUF1684 family)